jgi:hypothetical protein
VVTVFQAFEFHGKQHFESVPGWGWHNLATHQQRDKEKRDACAQSGVKLIEISYKEWNSHSTTEELMKILKRHVPHLVPRNEHPVLH